jgi:hypothetical protein
MRRLVRSAFELLLVAFCLGGLSSQALAQGIEVEPNDPCAEAQDIGPIDVTGATSIQGSLDTPPDDPDVDFFRFSTTPGAQLVADHEGEETGAGTLSDPFLGLFDTDCNLLASNDDASGSLNSRLVFDVAPDGTFILAATAFADDQFTGDGSSSGTYQLTISEAPPSIGSISGRIVGAPSGEPLAGNETPFAIAELLRCDGDDCFDLVNSLSADAEGRFRFDRDSDGQPLPVGTYQASAVADEFERAETDPFEVVEGEDVDLGDILLHLPPISFSEIRPCEDLLPQEDTCRYSVRVTNNTDAPVRALAWSVVDGSGLDSSLTVTTFEASTRGGSRRVVRERLTLEPMDEATLEFRFDVPPGVVGATFCPRVSVGIDPDPLVTTVREAFLFCITGIDSGFQVLNEGGTQKMVQALSGRSRNPPDKRPAPVKKQ